MGKNVEKLESDLIEILGKDDLIEKIKKLEFGEKMKLVEWLLDSCSETGLFELFHALKDDDNKWIICFHPHVKKIWKEVGEK